MSDRVMTSEHLMWEEFNTRLAGEEGLHARSKGEALTWDCDHRERMAFTRYLPSEYAGVNVEASIAWFRGRGWRCDCDGLFFPDSTSEERTIWRAQKSRRGGASESA
jgi:hypothetical protein